MKKNICLIIMLLLSNGISACIIDQLSTNNANYLDWPEASPTWGQSFEACETGPVWEIAIWPHWSTVGIHSLVLKDINCVPMWTVSNINITGLSQVTIDLSTGSGSSRNVTSGTKYIFHLVGPSGGVISMYTNLGNPYLQGEDIADNCLSYGLDWWFRVGINEGLGALPVELSDFQAKLNKENNEVELNFKTQSEINASHFAIEHSPDGKSYENIGTIKANGTSSETQSYYFVHQNPSIGNNYYRLKQVDNDGSFEYSKVVTAMVAPRKNNFMISPNPAVSDINVFMDVPFEKALILELFGLDGKLRHRQVLQGGTMHTSINGDNLSPGIYFLKISENGRTLWMDKVVKQ